MTRSALLIIEWHSTDWGKGELTALRPHMWKVVPDGYRVIVRPGHYVDVSADICWLLSLN